MRSVCAIAALGMLVAACSGGGGGNGDTKAVSDAVNATIGGATIRETVRAVTPTASGSQTAVAVGGYSFVTHLGSFTADTGAVLGRVTVFSGGSTLYIAVPGALASAVPAGKKYVSASLDNPPSIPGAGNFLSLAGGTEPTRVFEALQNAVTSASKVGASTVNGTATTQYTVKIDLASDKSPLAASEAKLIGGTKETVDVYVGPTGKLVRLVAHVALSGGATGTITSDYYGYGMPLSLQLPPPDQVIDAKTVLGQ
jgi:hypothetical protein